MSFSQAAWAAAAPKPDQESARGPRREGREHPRPELVGRVRRREQCDADTRQHERLAHQQGPQRKRQRFTRRFRGRRGAALAPQPERQQRGHGDVGREPEPPEQVLVELVVVEQRRHQQHHRDHRDRQDERARSDPQRLARAPGEQHEGGPIGAAEKGRRQGRLDRPGEGVVGVARAAGTAAPRPRAQGRRRTRAARGARGSARPQVSPFYPPSAVPEKRQGTVAPNAPASSDWKVMLTCTPAGVL